MDYDLTIINLQKKILLRKFLIELEKNKEFIITMGLYLEPPRHINMFDPEKQRNERFDEMRNILIKNMRQFDALLDCGYRYFGFDTKIAPKINSRKMMTAWMITSFPEFILEIPKPQNRNQELEDKYPRDIYFIAYDFIQNLNNICHKNTNHESLRKFKKSFNKYSNAIHYFLKRDKNEQIQKLLNEFINMNKTIGKIKDSKKYTDDETKEKSIQIINLSKYKIASHLKRLDSGIELDDLEVQFQIHDVIEKNMERALCDILIKDIENKKFSYFSNFMDEVVKHMISLGAKKIDGSFEERMDKDFIIQKMTYMNIEHEQIVHYGDYMVYIINNLQSSAAVDDTKDNWENLKNNSDEKSELLGKLVLFILKEIKIIYETISDIDTATKMGINIFDMQ